MKNFNFKFKFGFVLFPLLVWGVFSCSDSFLNVPAKGAAATAQLQSKKGIELEMIGAYNALNGQGSWGGTLTGWVFGGVVGQEAYKGSNSGDQSDINSISTFDPPATDSYLGQKWSSTFNGVVRANSVLKLIAAVPDGTLPDAEKTSLISESRFLRGIFNFEGRKLFKMVPYIDESIDYTLNNYNVGNDKEIYPYIISDLKFAYANLPDGQPNAGRANKWAAGAFLGKVYLYAAGHLAQAAYYDSAYTVLTAVVANGKTASGAKYALNAKFRDSFEAATDNSAESIFAIQASVNDGSGAANSNADLNLNFPYNVSPFCCGFFQPSCDLANSYRTSAGLPLLDGTFNSAANGLTDLQWLNSPTPTSVPTDNGPLDPRIDWIIGRTGVPFFDWGIYPGPSWVRQASDAGPYGGKKLTFPLTELGVYSDADGWGAIGRAVNYNLMRVADLKLMAAEAAIEKASPDLAYALTQVNDVRTRAANPAGFVVKSTGTKSDWAAYLDPTAPSAPAGNYVINTYASFASVSAARLAIHMERKLELGMEGHRFFDLVRWGEIHASNPHGNPDNLESAYLYNSSKAGSAIYKNLFVFTDGKNEYFPIPQNQIDLSGGLLKQNYGN